MHQLSTVEEPYLKLALHRLESSTIRNRSEYQDEKIIITASKITLDRSELAGCCVVGKAKKISDDSTKVSCRSETSKEKKIVVMINEKEKKMDLAQIELYEEICLDLFLLHPICIQVIPSWAQMNL